jgi:DNA-binding ferritin-like protein
MVELSIIEEQFKIPRAELMLSELLEDTEKMAALVTDIFDVATKARAQGIANYLAELQDLYTKKAWMLRATLNKSRA